VEVLALAEAFGQLPDDVAERTSELWAERALTWLSERNAAHSGRRGRPASAWPVVTPDADGQYTL